MSKALRAAPLLGAAAILVWTAVDPRLRDASGFPGTPAAFALAVACALTVLWATAGRSTARSGAWFAVAVVGWAAQLQLIEAGPRVAYQHLTLPNPSGSISMLLAGAVLAAQAVLVAWAAPPVMRPLLGKVVERTPAPLLVLGGLFLLGVAAVPSADPGAYVAESVASLLLQFVHLSTAALAVMALPESTVVAVRTWLQRPSQRAFPTDVLIAAVFMTTLSAALCLLVYEVHPHVPDEFVYLRPARYFAAGMLSQAAPPVAAAFDIDLMVNDGARWYSPVPPGWPAALAIGYLVGAPWLVNPVLGGACVLLTWRLVSSVYDQQTARLATWLLASSPWLIFLSMSFMTHVLPLFCALLAAVSVDEARRRSAVWPAFVGGAALGWIALTRPLDAVAAALACGVWALWMGLKSSRLGAPLALTLGSMAVAALTLPYNRYFTGSATQFPLMVYTDVTYGDGTNALGFGAKRGLGWPGLDPFPGHGAIDVVVNAVLNLSTINVELLGWGAGSLLLVTLLGVGRRVSRADVAMAAATGLVIFLHSFYWFSGGPDFAARYWFLIVVPLCVLSARAVLTLPGPDASAAATGRAITGALSLSLIALITFVPWRAVDKYHDYRGMEPGVRVLARDAGFGGGLVFVRGNRHPDYASAAFYNPLDWESESPIYAWDRSWPDTREALAAVPNRPVWIVEGPTMTGTGYRVVQGPISPDSAAAYLER